MGFVHWHWQCQQSQTLPHRLPSTRSYTTHFQASQQSVSTLSPTLPFTPIPIDRSPARRGRLRRSPCRLARCKRPSRAPHLPRKRHHPCAPHGGSGRAHPRSLPTPSSCKDSYFYYANCLLCNKSSFLIRLIVGTLFVRPFSYSYFCILSYTHYHSCSFQYTKGFEELCNWKISTQDEREEGHNLTHFFLSSNLKATIANAKANQEQKGHATATPTKRPRRTMDRSIARS